MKKLFLIIIVTFCFFLQSFSAPLADTSIVYTDTLEFISLKGPRNASTDNYATLYVMRPAGVVRENSWFAILVNDDIVIKADNNCRYKLRVHKEGPLKLWVDGDDGRKMIDLDLKFHQDYYVSLELMPGPKNGNSVLKSLEAPAGEQLYKSITGKEYVINNPLIVNRHSELGAYRPVFVEDPHKSMQFGLMNFQPPVSLEYYYKYAEMYFFYYRDIFLSNSFSELTTMIRKEVNSLATQDEVLDYIKKQNKNGKALTSGKEKLISLSYEPFTGTNYNGLMVHYEVEDRDAPNRGSAKFLLMRQTDVWFCKKINDKKDVLTQVSFSERGLPEEIHLAEEIRFKALHFIKNVKFAD
jgi:hypothetical protein